MLYIHERISQITDKDKSIMQTTENIVLENCEQIFEKNHMLFDTDLNYKYCTVAKIT